MRSAANLPTRVWQGLQEHPAPSQQILLARKTFSIQMNNATRLFRGQRANAPWGAVVCEKSTPRTTILQAGKGGLGKRVGWEGP
ncbi:hypothetical protein Poly24_16190 [Rosistilla carotiformis]|uniref:Uncharacterized protein n=1 Tax=Rosistilla carotiformis TaxID=2528017 RepID=A0A518JQV1_9BACT|nr:hypothetical protein Poly24_16190 [Rosistilla carotiformis]